MVRSSGAIVGLIMVKQPHLWRVGFATLDPAIKREEENTIAYEKGLFYPVRIGDVIQARYQVLSKLGFGANSTVWFCRDLHKHRYAALKIHICSQRSSREAEVLTYLASINLSHPGRNKIRMILDAFEIDGPAGPHQCLVQEPLLTSLLHLQSSFPEKSLTEDMLKPLLREVFTALDYLHSEAHVVHTDIQAKNIMIGTTDPSIFAEWEAHETQDPAPRKIAGENIIYRSRRFEWKKGWRGFGMPLPSDFGEARIGNQGEHQGLLQPYLYRAPEVVLGMKWISKVDIWNVGVLSSSYLLAEMVSLLGAPPVEFLRRSKESFNYWDESGAWKGLVEVPNDSLEDSEEYLEGKNKELFLQFTRKMLRWIPEERQSARELLGDPWLSG